MSIELHAFIHKPRVPSPEAWQQAIDHLGFDLKLDPKWIPFESSGFLPCSLNGELSGFEIYYEPAAVIVGAHPEVAMQIDGRDYCISFRWGSRPGEAVCAYISAAALSQAFDAFIYDPQESRLTASDQLIRDAQDILQGPPDVPQRPRPFWRRLFGRS